MSTAMELTAMVKPYVKPSLSKIILRKPRTIQTSARVKAQQITFANKMKGNKIATACKGKKARAFYGCLRTEGHRAYTGGKA